VIETFSVPLGLSPDISLYYEVEGNAQSRFYNSDLKVFYLQKNNDHQFYINEDNCFSEGRKYLPLKLFTSFRSQIYRFKAERPNQESYFFGSDSELEPNAENLGEVLNILQGRATKNIFERYNQCISAIFPDIKEIAVQPKPLNPRGNDSILEIRVWPKEAAENDREDLSFPLSECGTGISQVLAILYIVITSAEPRIIIIDEPQSFLHPGAAKKLIGIFKQFPQHQYFIATHSPALITAANPSTIVKLRHEDGETKGLVMKSEDLKEQSTLLAELGVSLSDVFGADSILWVEGPTEELCFPMILDKIAKKPLRGIQILAVKNTGDLEGKRAEIIFDIYDKLSGGNSLFPPTIGFIFDREGRLDSDIEKLKNRSKKPVEFLERRMYENYLLHPKAIAAIINDDDKERTQPLSAVEVQEWIDKAKQESSYLLKNVKPNQLSESEWLCQVDGAKLLSDIFSNLSETRVAFRKTTHSPKITEWLIDNEPEQLSELEKPLVSLLE